MSRWWMASMGLWAACGGPTVELGVIPGTATVSWSSGKEGAARVVVVEEGTEEEVLSPFGPVGTDHELPLYGLRTTKSYEVAVEVDVDGKISRSPSVTVDVPPPPEGVLVFQNNVMNLEKMCDPGGYVLFSALTAGPTSVGIVDRNGSHVWAYLNDIEGGSIGRPRPGRDGQSIIWNVADEDRETDMGAMVCLSLDGTERVETRALWAHHDFVELPDQETFAWNGYCFDETLLFENPSTGKDEPLAGELVVEGPKGASTTDDADAIWDMCDPKDWPYPKDFEATNFNFLPGYMEYAHGNSLAYLPEHDAYLVMFRWIDTLVKIDRDGNLLWVLGGKHDQFTAVKGEAPQSSGTSSDLFLQSHFSDAWVDDDGNIQILVFDNRERGNNSRIKQFTIDEKAMTYALDWGYQTDEHENLLGDVRRIPIEGCDNLLVALTTQARIIELTREGEIVWEIEANQLGAATTRVHFLPDLYDMSDYAYP